jgi:hypothetical protein
MRLKRCLGTIPIVLLILSIFFIKTAGPALARQVQTLTRPVEAMPLPDLKVLSFRLLGEVRLSTEVRGGRRSTLCAQQVALEIKNDSQVNINQPFRIYFFYEVPGLSTYRFQIISGTGRNWYVTVDRMTGGETKRFYLTLGLSQDFLGSSGLAYAFLDVADEEFMSPHGRIQESDERNNQSPKLDLRLPLRLAPVRGQSLETQQAQTLSITESFLDILGSTIKGQIHLNNDNGHPDDDHFTRTNPFRANDCSININIGTENHSGTFNLPEIYFEKSGSHYHYYVRDLDCLLAGGPGRLGHETLNIASGKFMIKLPFETSGRVELRGWEYTLGVYYDLSAPDIDITKLDFYVYLTPVIREGKLSYSDIQVVPDIDIRFTGALDTVFMNDALYRIRSAMRDHMQATIRPMLLDSRIKQAFEEGAMNALRSLFGVNRVESLRAEDNRIVIEYR